VKHFTGGGMNVCWKAVMSSQRVVAAGFGDLWVRLWDFDSGRELHAFQLPGIVASLEFSADGKRLFMGCCGDKTVRWLDVTSGKVEGSAKTKKSGAWFVALAPDGQRGVSAASDKLVHVWDLATGKDEPLAGHASKINGLAFFPDGRCAASASSDKTVRLWDVVKAEPLGQLIGHRKAVAAVAVSPDGERVASAGLDDAVIVWDAKRRTELARANVPRGCAAAIAFSPDGKQLLVGGGDQMLRLFAV
jgi:WD40 repeat protein